MYVGLIRLFVCFFLPRSLSSAAASAIAPILANSRHDRLISLVRPPRYFSLTFIIVVEKTGF